jgi:predicted secreted protein
MKIIGYLNGLGIVVLCCLLAGCDDIFEADISKEEVAVIAPADSVTIKGNELSFMWEMLSGASHYHLQLVEPSFEEARRVVVDTLLNTNSFSVTVDFGQYEWRLRAENSGYATSYSYYRVLVDSSSNIEDFRVELLTPSDNHETQAGEHTFSWKPLAKADYYIFQLEGNDTTIFQKLNDTSLKVTFNTRDDSFSWKVLALEAEAGRSTSSGSRSLRIDNTPPDVPELELPADNAVLSSLDVLTFSWIAIADSDKDFKGYILYLYNKNNLSVPVLRRELGDTQIDLFGGDDPLIPGQYLWEVQTVDRLGNTSLLGSLTRSFEVR